MQKIEILFRILKYVIIFSLISLLATRLYSPLFTTTLQRRQTRKTPSVSVPQCLPLYRNGPTKNSLSTFRTCSSTCRRRWSSPSSGAWASACFSEVTTRSRSVSSATGNQQKSRSNFSSLGVTTPIGTSRFFATSERGATTLTFR